MRRFTHIPTTIPEATLTDGHKYRTPDGRTYPSVTTILKDTKPFYQAGELAKWESDMGQDVADYIMRTSATIGTQAHQLNENYLNMVEGGEAMLLARAHHENFKPHLDRIDNIYGNELSMFSDRMRIAGTADCIAEYDGVLSVIDYKTKRSAQQSDWLLDYYQQTAAYCMMFTEHTNITIKQCVVLVSSEADTIQAFFSDPSEHAYGFLERLAAYDGKFRKSVIIA